MDRRTFLKNATATGAALATAGLLGNQSKAQGAPPPNILFILVDELRYPSVFPKGIYDAGGFLRQFMPNTYELLWQPGVKFAKHFTASVACTPARGTLVTGLYSQQSWLMTTILDSPSTTIAAQPVLRRHYPTFGRLLKKAGYQTPYIGKWHLSIPHGSSPDQLLEAYGFDGMTTPDPTGSNLQGTIGDADPVYGTGPTGDGTNKGYLNDDDIATQAMNWLAQRQPGDTPWCLTVGFINPHDKQYFPAGTEFQTFTNLYPGSGYQQILDYTNPKSGAPKYDWDADFLKTPPSLAYPPVPPNWETAHHIAETKPSPQTYARLLQEAIWGGINDDPNATDFSIVEYPTNRLYPQPSPPFGVAKAPYSYWQRGLDSYTQIMQILDGHIGDVINALPDSVKGNTIIILTSDHGEYAGAHGFVSGKSGSAYDEVYNVPLIVYDPTGRFTGDIEKVRMGLTSSVDMLPMLVSLGYNGSSSWMTLELRRIYGRRHDLLPMLQSDDAAGRPYVVFATDEVVPPLYNFNNSGGHIIGVRTQDAKLGVYAHWRQRTTDIAFNQPIEFEYYDYSTAGGRAETDNTYSKHNLDAQALYALLLSDILPNELRGPLPSIYVPAQTTAKLQYILYTGLIKFYGSDQIDQLPFSIGDI